MRAPQNWRLHEARVGTHRLAFTRDHTHKTSSPTAQPRPSAEQYSAPTGACSGKKRQRRVSAHKIHRTQEPCLLYLSRSKHVEPIAPWSTTWHKKVNMFLRTRGHGSCTVFSREYAGGQTLASQPSLRADILRKYHRATDRVGVELRTQRTNNATHMKRVLTRG